MHDMIQLSRKIKAEARRLGFSACGIAQARFLEEDAPRFEKWLKNGNHASMRYMENYFDKRLDPRKLVENARSVISVALNYFTPIRQENAQAPKLSKYAFGTDYHFVVKAKLRALLEFVRAQAGQVNGRYFTDSAPVLDRTWARLSGIGWVGKSSQLITRHGSWVFLGELIIDLALDYDSPAEKDYCGSCKRCIEACPTGAILPDKSIDSRKCISYLTIENRDEIPPRFRGKTADYVFGCDICQQVCPWNLHARPHKHPELVPKPEILKLSPAEWFEMDKKRFNRLFKNSAVKRTRFKGLQRNLEFLKATQ